jgi:FlaA1/EpsC-like NDP-sugar epimerase
MIADFFITFLLLFMLRMIMVLAYNIVKGRIDQSRSKVTRVLVYGVGVRSVSMLNRLQDSKLYDVIGFLQYGSTNVRHVISERKVFYIKSEEDIKNVIKEHMVDALLFTSEDEIQTEKDNVIRFALDIGLKLLSAPPIDEMVDGKYVHKIRNIDIEDLLMRSEIKISMSDIVKSFRGKTILVTGAAGSIGSELCNQLAMTGIDKLILFDNAETPVHTIALQLSESFPELDFVPVVGDVRMQARLDYVFRRYNPQVVFHAAAYKHVPLMEENPCEAVLVNVAGTRNVADKCVEYGVEMMVMVSTDKAVNPTNIMGCTKRIAEVYIQSLGLAIERGEHEGSTKFVTTRF